MSFGRMGGMGRGFGHLGASLGRATGSGPAPPNTLQAGVGTFALAGDAMSPFVDRAIPSALGTFTLSGIDAGLLAGRSVPSAQGIFALTGIDAALTKSASFSITKTDNAEDNTSQTTYNWSGHGAFAIGPAAASRKVVFAVIARAGTVSTPSISTNVGTATQVGTTVTNGSDTLSLWEVPATSGTTCTISATFSSAPLRASIVLFSVIGSNGVTPTGTAIATDATNNASTGSPVVPVGGGAIIVGATNGTISGATPTNFTQDLPATLVGSTLYYTAGHDTAHSGSTAYTITWATVPGSSIGIFSAYGP